MIADAIVVLDMPRTSKGSIIDLGETLDMR
jgi:hypothetical protein